MDNLDNISTVSELLNAQQKEEKIQSPADQAEEAAKVDEDFDKGQELLDEVRKLRPDIWLKVARRLILDASDLHRDIVEKLAEDNETKKALGWAYDTAMLDAAVKAIDSVKL